MNGEQVGGGVDPWAYVTSRRRATAWPKDVGDEALAVRPGRVGAAPEQKMAPLKAGVVYRFVMGVDPKPVKMPRAQLDLLDDPMGQLLQQGTFPLVVADLLAEVDTSGLLPDQASYLIGEAGQIRPQDAPQLHRDFRFVVIRSRAGQADLLVSTSANDPTGFLQVAAWASRAGIFNYYMRLDKTWVWAGDSNSALAPGSRGMGCFDSHVNGSVVMKELRQPWMNWDSVNATIQLADGDPLRKDPLYRKLSNAENLERTVRAGVSRWTASRLARTISPDGVVSNVDWLLRQLCTSTTVNLASSTTESRVAAATASGTMAPPVGFWLNFELLLDGLGIPADFEPPAAPAALYAKGLTRYGFALVEDDFRQPGDTFFAFVVPEAAFEDVEVVQQLVARGVITDKFAASVLMVDFANPVFSPARAQLLRHVPTTATLDPARGGLSGQVADAIVAAAKGRPASAPDAQFAANWRLKDTEWQSVFAARIEAYMKAVTRRIATAKGFDDYLRLAESRRRELRQMFMRLNEFSLTLPVTNIAADAPLLAMRADGTVRAKAASQP